jgi:flagellar protein FlgJ
MINPPSDIILDVVRAADPGKQAKASQRLAALAGDGSGNPRAFAAAMENSSRNSGAGPAATQNPFRAAEARVAMHNRDTLGAPGGTGASPGSSDLRTRLDPMAGASAGTEAASRSAPAANRPMTPDQEFEAFILRTFVETMLPDDATASYGSGTAGDIWKGMKAEQIGNALARSGGIGIADKLARLHPSEAPQPSGAGFGVTPTQAAATIQASSGEAEGAGTIERLMGAQTPTGARPALEDLAHSDDIFSDPHEASLFFAGLWRNGS